MLGAERERTAVDSHAPAINTVGHEQVKVHGEIERTTKPLHRGYGAGHRARALMSGKTRSFVYAICKERRSNNGRR